MSSVKVSKMARDYNNGSPKHHHLESKRKRLTWILGVSGLCILSYVLGSWQNNKSPTSPSQTYNRIGCDEADSRVGSSSSSSSAKLDFESHHTVNFSQSEGIRKLPPCDMSLSEYTPCQHPPRGRKFDRNMLIYRERHCPAKEELLLCLIPAPPKYKTPFKWPQSRDFAWYDNIPHKELSIEKAIQNWIQVEGDRFRFPGGGTMFPRGADAYIDDINELIPLTTGAIRTAIDTGCGVSDIIVSYLSYLFIYFIFGGYKKNRIANLFALVDHVLAVVGKVASWGAYLLKRNILTMSFAPRDTHEAQVQFALERGVPAMIGIMASQRIPYPARAFDMAHCSRCLIPWSQHGI